MDSDSGLHVYSKPIEVKFSFMFMNSLIASWFKETLKAHQVPQLAVAFMMGPLSLSELELSNYLCHFRHYIWGLIFIISTYHLPKRDNIIFNFT